jgi:predicted nucleic acid-binding protein
MLAASLAWPWTNDLWIAATSIDLGAVLVTRDADFSRVAGLVIEDWTT